MKLKEIKDEPGLMKDLESGAIINTDRSAIKAAKARKQAMQENKERIDKIENDVTEIKNMLKELIGKQT